MRILLVEDDVEIAGFISRGLREAGYFVEHQGDGGRGLDRALSGEFDAMILDRMLPSLDGLSLLATVRNLGVQLPVLLLSALGSVDEKVKGLQIGGDDYLVKPFAVAELLARLGALLRRGQTGQLTEPALKLADLELDRLGRRAQRAGQLLALKPQEYRLLEFLMRHAGEVVTRTMLLEGVWDYHFDPQTNVIDVHISRLRAKVDAPPWPPLIHTIRGAGYCLRAPQTTQTQ